MKYKIKEDCIVLTEVVTGFMKGQIIDESVSEKILMVLKRDNLIEELTEEELEKEE